VLLAEDFPELIFFLNDFLKNLMPIQNSITGFDFERGVQLSILSAKIPEIKIQKINSIFKTSVALIF